MAFLSIEGWHTRRQSASLTLNDLGYLLETLQRLLGLLCSLRSAGEDHELGRCAERLHPKPIKSKNSLVPKARKKRD